MEMERQNKKMQVWNLLAEKIRKLVEESVSNPEELQEIRIRTGQPLLIQMKGQERVLPDPAHPYLVTKEDIGVRQWDIFVIIRSMHMKMS